MHIQPARTFILMSILSVHPVGPTQTNVSRCSAPLKRCASALHGASAGSGSCMYMLFFHGSRHSAMDPWGEPLCGVGVGVQTRMVRPNSRRQGAPPGQRARGVLQGLSATRVCGAGSLGNSVSCISTEARQTRFTTVPGRCFSWTPKPGRLHSLWRR